MTTPQILPHGAPPCRFPLDRLGAGWTARVLGALRGAVAVVFLGDLAL